MGLARLLSMINLVPARLSFDRSNFSSALLSITSQEQRFASMCIIIWIPGINKIRGFSESFVQREI